MLYTIKVHVVQRFNEIYTIYMYHLSSLISRELPFNIIFFKQIFNKYGLKFFMKTYRFIIKNVTDMDKYYYKLVNFEISSTLKLRYYVYRFGKIKRFTMFIVEDCSALGYHLIYFSTR